VVASLSGMFKGETGLAQAILMQIFLYTFW
jgi:hypothetical protein